MAEAHDAKQPDSVGRSEHITFKSEMKADFGELRKDFSILSKDVELKIAESKADIIKWFVSISVLQSAAYIASKFLH